MKKVSTTRGTVKQASSPVSMAEEFMGVLGDPDTRVAAIQSLIPLGLAAVCEALQEEVEVLCGARYARRGKNSSNRRWGSQPGSVYLADQKTPVRVPRVRDTEARSEVTLKTYRKFQQPAGLDEKLFHRVLSGLASRRYADSARLVPCVFGLSSSSVSRRFVAATARKLAAFQERDLSDLDLVAVFMDGKTFADEQMLVCLGVTIDGRKIPLGFEQTVTENERVASQFLQKLVARGLRFDQGLLVVIDGARGLASAVKRVFADHVLIQRCQWHKRENVLSYLAKSEQTRMRRKLQSAYNQKTFDQARSALMAIRSECAAMNPSAANSLDEGMEETLTLHRLGMMPFLKQSFRTTNCIESVNSQVAHLTRNVKRWTTAKQRHRWLAACLMDIEPRLRAVKGYRYLPMLRAAIQRELKIVPEVMTA